jgi:SulP family sulfate permease
LEDCVLGIIAERPEVKHLVLSGIAINFIDASALETLVALVEELRNAGVEFHLAEIKGPVMDRLKVIGFVDKIGPDHIHLSTHDAMQALNCV